MKILFNVKDPANSLYKNTPKKAFVASTELCQVAADFWNEKENTVPDTQPLVDLSKGEVRSDTGELYRNWEKNLGIIDTDMTKCAYGSLCKNGDIKLNGVKIKCDTDYAVIALSSLTDAPITSSDNILLTTVGRAENTDFKMEGELMLDIGKAPVLVENIEAEIAIDTDQTDMTVWAISAEGYYIGTVPTEVKDGKLTFKTGKVSRSMYYLIVKS